MRQVFAGMSQRSRFLRYHRATSALPPSMVAALVDIRPGHHVAFAAEIGGEPVGIVRWIRLPGEPTHAEIAAEVVDAVQGCGLGRRLAAAAARSALAVGVDWFTLWVHSGNLALRQRLLAVNARVAVDDPDEFRVPVTSLLPVKSDETVTPVVLSRFSVDPASMSRVSLRGGGRRLRD